MKMKEREFLKLLEARAEEVKQLRETGILPDWAGFLGEWLGVNPWRVIGLAAVAVYAGLRLGFGVGLREGVLKLFGGF